MWYQKLLREYLIYLKEHSGIAFLLGLIVIIYTVHLLRRGNGRKLPPGPMSLPLLGYYPFLGKFPERTMNELAKKYGNIFSFYIGPQYVVVLNDYAVAKEALQQDQTLDRELILFDQIPFNFGFVGINGPAWQQARRLSTRIIKDTGLNRAGWEDLIKEEALDLVNQIFKEDCKAVDVQSMFKESFANNVMTLILGERLNPGNPLTKVIIKSVDAILQNSATMSMRNFSLTTCKLLQLLGFERDILQYEMVSDLGKFLSDTVEERLQNHYIEFEDSFIGRYQKEIQNQKESNKNSYINVYTLKGDTLAMLTGGGETIRTGIIWTLIGMAEHPHIQSKVQEELDAVIGREGSVTWADRHKVPYTYATLLESMRWRTIIPIPTPRIATDDTQIKGYHIPKGTSILLNIWAMHNDPKYWKNPEEFNPERFLTDDGKKVNTSPDSFAVFSYGKRNCPGRLLAHLIGLLYFVAIMQKFKVLPKEGNKVEHDIIYGVSYQATNVELRFIPR